MTHKLPGCARHENASFVTKATLTVTATRRANSPGIHNFPREVRPLMCLAEDSDVDHPYPF